MCAELFLWFAFGSCVIVSFNDESSGPLLFLDPLTSGDRDEIAWYLEYSGRLLGNHADLDGRRVVSRLPVWGTALVTRIC